MRRLTSAAVILTALSLPSAAAGHACLEHASPRVGSRVTAAPAEVRLWFSEPIEPVFSKITVSGPQGLAAAGAARAPGDDRRVLLAPLPRSLPPGRYVVQWRVISVDSHATQGDFQFELRP